ncbi:MAG: hypothetical protein J6Q85_06575 [Clostridia bacterium]|nr:hypothetical protein [Clostridia bacterium]
MIGEFSTKASPQNSNAKTVFFVLMALSAVFTLFYLLADRYKGLLGLAVMIFLVSAVYIYTRYVGVQYYYDLTHDNTGEAVFVVRRQVGKSSSTLARLGLSEISSVKRENRAEAKAHKTPYGYRKYFYTPTLMPSETVRLTVISPYESSEVIIEATEEYEKQLTRYIKEARGELYPEAE